MGKKSHRKTTKASHERANDTMLKWITKLKPSFPDTYNAFIRFIEVDCFPYMESAAHDVTFHFRNVTYHQDFFIVIPATTIRRMMSKRAKTIQFKLKRIN